MVADSHSLHSEGGWIQRSFIRAKLEHIDLQVMSFLFFFHLQASTVPSPFILLGLEISSWDMRRKPLCVQIDVAVELHELRWDSVLADLQPWRLKIAPVLSTFPDLR